MKLSMSKIRDLPKIGVWVRWLGELKVAPMSLDRLRVIVFGGNAWLGK